MVDQMKATGHDMVESFVQQHDDLNALSPSGVNTVRVFTLLDDAGNYSVLGCRLRISVDSPVDNLAAGNLAAPIDDGTGVVNGAGVYSDITRDPETVHPVTGVPIEGFRIPYWSETLKLVEKASRLHPENRSIGWDVVITPEGPGLIEGNHDWCKLVWQLRGEAGLDGGLRAFLIGSSFRISDRLRHLTAGVRSGYTVVRFARITWRGGAVGASSRWPFPVFALLLELYPVAGFLRESGGPT